MTESEKFIFKTLQWFMALGVTVMLFLQGYMITFVFETYGWKGHHEMKHQTNDSYYARRIYIDSTSCVTIKTEMLNIKQHIKALEEYHPQLEAIIPKEQETVTELDLKY